jgi:hypothetical protein
MPWKKMGMSILIDVYRVTDFLGIIHRRFFNLKQRFGEWTLPPSSGKKLTPMDPINTASPYLQIIYIILLNIFSSFWYQSQDTLSLVYRLF